MYLNDEKKQVVNNYINKSLLNKLLYLGRGLNIAEAFKGYINADYRYEHDTYNKLVNTLWNRGTKHIKDIFQGKEHGALKLLLGDTYAKIFKNVWDRSTLYIYSTGYDRRSYRTNKSTNLYLSRNIEKLKEGVYLAAIDFSLDKYFTDNKSNYEGISIISDIISIELDNNNPLVLEKIKEIVYNDNNIAILTREIIRGLLMSRNEEAHKVIGELLLAAKLQEGLRQAIVESMDECSKKAFIYILKIIIDNNLSRFSSVVRAFGTWTGIALDVERPKVINKCFEAAYNCLKNEVFRNECMDSNDNLLIYISIWAVAFDEVEDIDQIIYKLINSTEKYKKLVALQFLYDTQFMTFRHQVACTMTKETDLEVMTLVIKNLFGSLNSYSLKNNADDLNDYYELSENCHGIKLFNELKHMLDIMPKKEIQFKGSVFPWVDFKLTTAEIMEKMMLSVDGSYDSEIVDILIDYREKMNADTRGAFVETFLEQPENDKQKKALIEALGDRSSSVRQSAFEIVSKLPLSEEDYRLVESFLQYKSGDLRKNVIKMLLRQSNEEIVNCVERLTSSNNEKKRLAAIDIVSAIKGIKEQNSIYEKCLSCVASISDASQRERMLTTNIMKAAKDIKTFENGFGLYDKSVDYQVPPMEKK